MKPQRTVLEDVLHAREKRVQRIEELVRQHNDPLVSIKVNIPGPEKDHPLYRRALEIGEEAFKELLVTRNTTVHHRETHWLLTGAEQYLVVAMDAMELKKLCIEIENQHPLGRLLDIDVVDKLARSISRTELGYGFRKCLICDAVAHACARSRKHRVDDLITVIQQRIKDFLGGE